MSDKSPVYMVDLPDGGSAGLTMDQINRLKEKNPNWPEKAEVGKDSNTSATDAFCCSRCGCVLYPGDLRFGDRSDGFVCFSCLQTLLGIQTKKTEAAAKEKKARKFWFFGKRKG